MNTYEGARNEMAEAKIKLQGNDYILWAKISLVLDMSAPCFHICSPNFKYLELLS